ncbi:MAG: Uma2 family endonuclease, partial [Bacteroidetes bacterium]
TILFWKEEENQFVIANIDPNRTDYTFEDYLQLPYRAPYELMNGKLVFKPTPYIKHQSVLGELLFLLGTYNKKHTLGKVLFLPFDVLFDKNNCCQPDLLFINNQRLGILDELRANDAPDLTIEILSEDLERDYVHKMAIYAKFGVLEYWIIDLKTPKIDVYENQDSEMVLVQTAGLNGSIKSKVIKDFVLNLSDIF